MRFARLGAPSNEFPVVITEEGIYDLRSITPDIDGAFLGSSWEETTEKALNEGILPPVDDPADGSRLRIGAPIARPSAVICVGMNYAAHAAESGAEPPSTVVAFFKHPNTIVGPFDDVIQPPRSTTLDWEVELGIVIGRPARYLATETDAQACIAGYVLSHDVSERNFQLLESGGQWSKGKSAETFNPLGPWLAPAVEFPVAPSLELRSWVNGAARQHSSTDDMIFSPAAIVQHLSQYMALEPGDLINTGTPQGVALSEVHSYLTPGDIVELEIEQLGRQRQRIVSAALA